MPGVDGRQVVRTIKSESPDTHVVMLTGWGEMMKEDGEDVPRVDALISKPADIQELNALLLRVSGTSNPAPAAGRGNAGLTSLLQTQGAARGATSEYRNGDRETVTEHDL